MVLAIEVSVRQEVDSLDSLALQRAKDTSIDNEDGQVVPSCKSVSQTCLASSLLAMNKGSSYWPALGHQVALSHQEPRHLIVKLCLHLLEAVDPVPVHDVHFVQVRYVVLEPLLEVLIPTTISTVLS